MSSTILFCGSIYVSIAALVAARSWSANPDDLPGGGRSACVGIGALWPLLVVLIAITVAWWGIETMVDAVTRRRQ